MLDALLDEALEFPWQQTLLDAFMEWRPDYLPRKISAAERAIAVRSCEPTDLNEQIALGDALHTLHLLFSKEVSDDKFTNWARGLLFEHCQIPVCPWWRQRAIE